MSIIQNVVKRVTTALNAAVGVDNTKEFNQRVTAMLNSGELDLWTQEKAIEKYQDTKSKLDLRRYQNVAAGFYSGLVRSMGKNELPGYGSPSRDYVLSCFWQEEPILAGAIYSMAAKMSSLSWSITGKKNKAVPFAEILWSAGSSSGYDWGGFISPSVQDFYTTDRGTVWETPRVDGRISELGHIDSLCCAPTGIYNKPIYYYSSVTGQEIWFKPEDVIHFSSLPSGREMQFGNGFCAVSRVHKSAQLLLGLHKYDSEKLSNLPPEGVAAISGLTQDEFQDALALWQAAREKNKSLTFPQVLWLLGSQIGSDVKVQLTPFSQMPESFTREVVVNQYMNIVALGFGVDVREFWPVTSGALGSASESDLQHMKAKGKGVAEFTSSVERRLNDEFAETDEAEFQFDVQDAGEDQTAATIAKTWIDAFMPLATGQPSQGGGKPGGGAKGVLTEGEVPANKVAPSPEMSQGQSEPLIDKDTMLRLLVDRRVLPNWVVEDDRVAIYDSGISEKEETLKTLYRLGNELKEFHGDGEVVNVVWKGGKLTQTRLKPYKVIQPQNKPASDIPYAELLECIHEKEDEVTAPKRNIKGSPIPADEALRGTGTTKQAILAELERWRNNPILSVHLPELLDNNQILATLGGKA